MPFPFSYELKSESANFTVNPDGKFVKEYRSVYHCKSILNLSLDGCCAELGVLPGAPHPDWPSATARKISPTRLPTIAPFCRWDVEVTYSTEGVVPNDSSDPDPVLRRVKRRTGTAQQQRFIIKDRNGVLITDTAGSVFDGGVPVTDYLGTFIFERDEPHDAGSMSQASQLSGKLNSVTFAGCDPETLMLDVVGEEKWEGSYHYWTFTYTMTYDKDGWQPKPVNAGLYRLNATNERVRITEADGTNTQEPQPLGPSGGVIPVAARPGSCIFVDVDHYITFDFADLGLTGA